MVLPNSNRGRGVAQPPNVIGNLLRIVCYCIYANAVDGILVQNFLYIRQEKGSGCRMR